MATMNVTELATELNTTPRTARKFLRSVTPKDKQPGKGSRWEIEKGALRTIKKGFAQWEAEIATKGAVKADTPEVASE